MPNRASRISRSGTSATTQRPSASARARIVPSPASAATSMSSSVSMPVGRPARPPPDLPSSTAVTAGSHDLERAARELAERIPEPLAGLARLAYNYRWSWTPGGTDLFRSVDPRRWRLCGGNPVRLLQEASWESLGRAADDQYTLERIGALEDAVNADLQRPANEVGRATAQNPVAYFSAEFGIHASLPIYSGGLGALAGDILKEASDRATPMVAVGLMYRRGYLRQRVDASGWQQEYCVPTDPERTPATLVTNDDGR